MALVVADRVKETTTTTGTGTYTLAGAVDGFQSFAAIGNGNTCYYACSDGSDYEVGIGTYTLSGTTLARTTIIESSNSDAAVNWGAGEKNIFVTLPASKAIFEDASNNVAVGNNITVGGTVDGVDIAARDAVLTSTTTTANAALPKAGGTMTGNIVMSGAQTVDGRDLSVDGAKLDNIEANATADQTASEIEAIVNHDNLQGFVANEHIDWTASSAGTIHATNIPVVALTTVQTAANQAAHLALTAQEGDIVVRSDENKSYVHNGGTAGTMADYTELLTPTDAVLSVNGQTGAVTISNATTSSAGLMSSTDKSKLDGVESGAKADQTITAGAGLTGGGTGDVTISHADTSSQASVNGSGRTYIQDITLDTYGHVTGIATASETVVNTDTNTTYSLTAAQTSGTDANPNLFLNASSGTDYNVQLVGSGATTITRNSDNQITISSTDTNTNTNQLTTFQVEDGDGTEVTISHGKEWKFVEGGGIDINWTDTSTGSDADPYDLTFTHADTSTQASVDNSNGTVIQDVTLDGYGHVTGLGSVDLDSRYVNVTGDTMTGRLYVDSTFNDKLILRGSDDPSMELQNSADAFRGRIGISNTGKEIRVVGQDPDNTNNIHILGVGQNGLRYSTNNGGTFYKVWHANNDGSGSGLDADTLDGNHASSFLTGNQSISLSGDVTGSGTTSISTTIASNVVGAAELNVTGNGTTAQFLRSDGDGSFTWATPTDTNTTYSAGTGVTLSGTTFSIGQAVATTDSPTFTNAYIGGSLYHTGDTDTRLLFGTNTVTLQCGGSSEVTVNTTGVRLGDTGNGYFQPVTGNYGSIQIDGGAHGGYEGYSIGGRVVFMHNNGTASGIYNDVDNEWLILCGHNDAITLYFNGAARLNTSSTGVTIAGDLNSTSDIRYKKNIETIDSALEKVQSLRGVTFDWDNDAFPEGENTKKPNFTERATGVIAQDVEKVLPEAVRENEDGFKNVAYGNMVGLLIEAIKEQQQQIDALKKQLNG